MVATHQLWQEMNGALLGELDSLMFSRPCLSPEGIETRDFSVFTSAGEIITTDQDPLATGVIGIFLTPLVYETDRASGHRASGTRPEREPEI